MSLPQIFGVSEDIGGEVGLRSQSDKSAKAFKAEEPLLPLDKHDKVNHSDETDMLSNFCAHWMLPYHDHQSPEIIFNDLFPSNWPIDLENIHQPIEPYQPDTTLKSKRSNRCWMPNLIKGIYSYKRDNLEPLLAHQILCEGGETDKEKQSSGDKDQEPKQMSLMNRVAYTLDISFLCEKLADYFV